MKQVKNKLIRELLKALMLFIVGGIVYYAMEILYDGDSHWTMAVTGGICFVIGDLLDEFKGFKLSVRTEVVIISITITVLEFFVGIVVNLMLKLDVWDYSGMYLNLGDLSIPMHVMGQISLPFILLWTIIFAPLIIYLGNLFRWDWFNEEKPLRFVQVYKCLIFGKEYERKIGRVI